MEIHEIEEKGVRLAIHIKGIWEEGITFFSQDNDYQQVGVWRYNKGKELQQHRHLEAERIIRYTQEVIYVQKGKVSASIFGLKDNLVQRLNLQKGDILVLLAGGHGYKILEDDTQVLEIKNGPYLGPEKDRKRI